MKEGWKIRTLGDVSMSISDGDWIEKKDQSQSGIRLIQTGNIGIGFFKDNSDKARYISEETFTKLKCTEVVNGDILISRLPDPVGRACIIPKLSTKNITAVDCSIVRLKQNILNQRFFIYYSQSDDYFSDISKQCSGSTRTRITKTRLSNIFIPIPPLSEQQRIVEILDTEFAKIDALKANAEKSLQAAKDLFQTILNETFSTNDKYSIMTINDVCYFQNGFAFKSNTFTTKGEPILRISNIQNDEVVENDLVFFKPTSYKEDLSRFIVYPNDIVIAMSGGTTGKIGINKTGKTFYLNQRVGVFRENKNLLNHEFLFYYLHTKSEESLRIAAGAAQPNLSTAQIKAFTIPIPNLDIQKQLVKDIKGIDERCKALQENYRKTIALCEDLKQALLRKAFNGEL